MIESAQIGWSQAPWLRALDWDGLSALVGTVLQISRPSIQSLRQKRLRAELPKQSWAGRSKVPERRHPRWVREHYQAQLRSPQLERAFPPGLWPQRRTGLNYLWNKQI